MKATVYTALFLAAGGAVAWMIYQDRKPESAGPVRSFERDDQRLYEMIRADLQDYEYKANKDTLAWFDDMVSDNYETSLIAGRKSKTAAYVQTLQSFNGVHPRLRYYQQLLTNLQNRYANGT